MRKYRILKSIAKIATVLVAAVVWLVASYFFFLATGDTAVLWMLLATIGIGAAVQATNHTIDEKFKKLL